MPLSRYQIRNEYSLADPDLYRAADKDDPEALLEGVAMAALVGVLRQLGDLAEFAAEIFHDLHEEVMATASRGHSLMVRVQQLEAEFPTIEKAFLSQSSLSSFYYNAGIDWHPKMRMDQNLITQGDLPRFIMDSYEECRGPPRLFLLDKFDVAGAGACLKRYTDPSVFKVETSYSGITSADVLREKKSRKTKKKGSRWRNGETPETLPTSHAASHAKLHQLFLEERIENGTGDSARRVKLKRRLNGFPFQNRSGKSYMEKFLKSPSPDHGEVHEIPVDSSPLALPYYESSFEIVEISTVSPEKESKLTMRSPSSSPTRNGTTLESAIDELNEVPSLKGISDVSKSNSGLEATDISSTIHKRVTEKEISVDGGIKTEGSVDGYQSDDVASEMDNYVDALATMESELDTDSELRSKNDFRYLNNRRQASDLDVNDEQVHAHSSDSQSFGNSTLSDDGNSSSKKDLSSFSYSDSHSTSAENTPSDGEVSSNVFTFTEIHEAEDSPIQQSIGEEGQVSQPQGGAVSDGALTDPVEIPSHSSELGDPTASSSPSDSAPVFKNEEAVVKEIASVGPETDEMVAKLSMDLCLIFTADIRQQEGDCSSPHISCDNQHVDEFEDENTNTTVNSGSTPHLSVPSLSRDGFPFQVSAENKFDDKLEDEDGRQQEDLASTSDLIGVPHAMDENQSLLSSQCQPLDKLHDEDPNWRDDSSSVSNPSDTPLPNRDDLSPKISAENSVEDPNFLLDGLLCASDTMIAGTEKKITENMLVNVPQIGHAEDNLVPYSIENQIGPQNLEITLTEDQSIDPQNLDITLTEDQSMDPMSAEFEPHYSKVEPEERVSEIDDATPSAGEKAKNVFCKEDTSIMCKSVESFVSGATSDIPPFGPLEEISYLRKEYFDEPSNLGDAAVTDEAISDPDLLGIDTTSEPSLIVHVHFDEVDHEPLNVPTTFAGHDDHAVDDASSVDPKKLQEGPLHSVVDGHNGLEAVTCLVDRPGESDVTEDVYCQKFASPDLNSLGNMVTDRILGLPARDDSSNTYIVSEARCSVNSDDAPTHQSSGQQNEEELQHLEEKVGLLAHYDSSNTYIVSEARSSLNSGDAPTRQSSAQQNEEELQHLEEKVDLLPQECEQKLLDGGEADSELLNHLQQTHHSNHDDQVGPFDASFKSLLLNIPSQPSASELLPQSNNMINVTEHLLDQSSSLSSGFSLLPNSSQIFVEEMPPLPPLPPVQWRMGKLQHANQPPERVSAKHCATASPPLLPCSSNQEAQPLTPFLPPSVSAYEMSTPVSDQSICNTSPILKQVPPMVSDGDSKDNILPPEGIECRSTSLQLSESHSEMLQNDIRAGEGEKLQTSLDSSHASAIDTASAGALGLSHDEVAKPLNEMAPEKRLQDMELGQHSAHSEDNVMTSDTTELPANVANDHALPTSEENLSWPTAEDGKLHGVRTMKLARPRNPLIDAVAAHDKSKLRKVTERIRPQIEKEDERDSNSAAHDKSKLRKVTDRLRPQIQKEDERDSLLEQIRTKSFNLKPAIATRPSIQGPKTNLKVAAILEKAKTIRQAFAGSDEDDDDGDSWSDS